jgi:hypothetical protein
MCFEARYLLIAMTLAALSAPALADDCAAAKSAMLDSGHKPHSVTVTSIDAQGKQFVTKQVQTATNKYVQTKDGKWYAMNIAIKDLNDNTDSVKTCSRVGSDTVNGESTTVYAINIDQAGMMLDQKIWVSSKNLILKSEGKMNGTRLVTTFDFSNATPPANATPTGGG